MRLGDSDGPDPRRLKYIVTQRLLSQAVKGEDEPRTADNDNWPLAKVLRRDGLSHCMSLAERYRSVFDRATVPVPLIGSAPEDDMHVARRMDLDESTGALINKGVTPLSGKRHPVPEISPTRALRTDVDQPRARAKSVAKRWNGDLPLLDAIDCRNELAGLRHALFRVVDPFEAAVCHGDTLDEIGRRLGFKTDSSSRARAIVMDGFGAIDRFWKRRRAA